ncbi:hypothetical protein JCM17823_11350 [Halorubrum gandharaense]
MNSIPEKTPDIATDETPYVSAKGPWRMPYDSGVPKVNTIATAPTTATSQLRRPSGCSSYADTPWRRGGGDKTVRGSAMVGLESRAALYPPPTRSLRKGA